MTRSISPVRTIGIFSPSSAIVRERFENGVQILKQHGFDLIIHPQTYAGEPSGNQVAGSTTDKIAAFKDLQTNPDVDLIMASTGGNRSCFMTNALAPQDYGPKPIMGFSDTTALLSAAYTYGVHGIFGPTVQTLSRMPPNNLAATMAFLKTPEAPVKIDLSDARLLNTPAQKQKPHLIEAPIFVATLSVLVAMAPTRLMPDLTGHILILEDIGEELNNIDRMLWSLGQHIDFSSLAALIFGQFLDIKDSGRPYGEDIGAILANHGHFAGGLVFINAPIAHDGRIYPFPLGQKATLETENRVLIF